MNKILQAVILTALAIGATAEKTRKCEPGRDTQVVLADRQAKRIWTWSPDNCTGENFQSYPVPTGMRKYVDTLDQCGHMVFAKLEGDTKLVAYNLKYPNKGWKLVKMPRGLRKVINYAITCWGTEKLLVMGGRILRGPDGNNGISKNAIWTLDWSKRKFQWEERKERLGVAAYGSCAVTRGDLLTVMSGMTKPLELNKKVFIYNLKTGEVTPGQDIDARVTDCKIGSKAYPLVFALGMNKSGQLPAYSIDPDNGEVRQGPSVHIPPSKLNTARFMMRHQEENWLTVVGGRPIYVYVYDPKTNEWNKAEPVPASKRTDVLGVFE